MTVGSNYNIKLNDKTDYISFRRTKLKYKLCFAFQVKMHRSHKVKFSHQQVTENML